MPDQNRTINELSEDLLRLIGMFLENCNLSNMSRANRGMFNIFQKTLRCNKQDLDLLKRLVSTVAQLRNSNMTDECIDYLLKSGKSELLREWANNYLHIHGVVEQNILLNVDPEIIRKVWFNVHTKVNDYINNESPYLSDTYSIFYRFKYADQEIQKLIQDYFKQSIIDASVFLSKYESSCFKGYPRLKY